MSTTILKFKVPEENDELYYAQHGAAYYSALFELDQKLRNMAKYENIKTVKIEDIRTLIRELTEGLEL